MAPRQHVLLPTKSSDRTVGKLSGRYENVYSFVSSFKLIRSSNKEAETKNEKRKVPFSLETTVLQSRQSTASLHFAFLFFANSNAQCNVTRREPEIILFAIP